MKKAVLIVLVPLLISVHGGFLFGERVKHFEAKPITPYSGQQIMSLKYSRYSGKVFGSRAKPPEGGDPNSARGSFIVMDLQGETSVEKEVTFTEAFWTSRDCKWPEGSRKVYFLKYVLKGQTNPVEFRMLYSFDTETGSIEPISPEGFYVVDYDLSTQSDAMLLQGFANYSPGRSVLKGAGIYLLSYLRSDNLQHFPIPDARLLGVAFGRDGDSVRYFSRRGNRTELREFDLARPGYRKTLWKVEKRVYPNSVEWSPNKYLFMYSYSIGDPWDTDHRKEGLSMSSIKGLPLQVYATSQRILEAKWSPSSKYLAFETCMNGSESARKVIGVYEIETRRLFWISKDGESLECFDWISDTDLVCGVRNTSQPEPDSQWAIYRISIEW
ncbi:hypothetical protein HZA56_08405 [Candidatus Poribacteria bacterium]|nr:hypothetical protein [Candidatus Poribacteria bacterium]